MGRRRSDTTEGEEFSPPIQVRLTARQWDYIAGGVRAGRWGTLSEALRASVHALMRLEGKA